MRLKNLSILILIAASCLGVSKCPENVPPFEWNPEIWVADSQVQGIARNQAGETKIILCSEEKFDQMVCLHRSEPRKAKEAYFKVINQCERWKNPKDKDKALQFFSSESLWESQILSEIGIDAE